jgi:hypothetical protein
MTDTEAESIAEQWLRMYHENVEPIPRRKGKKTPDYRVTTAWGYTLFVEVKGIVAPFTGHQPGGQGVAYPKFNNRLESDLLKAEQQLASADPEHTAGQVVVIVSAGDGPSTPFTFVASTTGLFVNPFTGEITEVATFRTKEQMQAFDLVVYINRGKVDALLTSQIAFHREEVLRAFPPGP